MRANANKRKQTQTNADKRKQTQRRKRKQTQANASKRGQTQTNSNKPPFIAVFYTPLCNPLKNSREGNQPAPYRGLSGPLSPKCRKSLENVCQGLRPWGPQKSPKVWDSQKNTLQTLFGDSPETSQTVPETFVAGGPGDIFEIFSAFRARRARETLARGGLVPNKPPPKSPTQIKTVCAQTVYVNSFCLLFSAYFKEKEGTLCTNSSAIVGANSGKSHSWTHVSLGG